MGKRRQNKDEEKWENVLWSDVEQGGGHNRVKWANVIMYTFTRGHS